jgi:hypothetical protein
MPGTEPNAPAFLDLLFRARPGDSEAFREVVVTSWSHIFLIVGGE